jgi:ketosteroid isomerase-like protein
MYRWLGVPIIVLLAGGAFHAFAGPDTSDKARQEAVSRQIIAYEKAWADAWQKRDKAFLTDYYASDGTGYMPWSPYLLTDPGKNLFPKLDKVLDQFRILDWEMYNPHVQVYGDVAILTYNEMVTANVGGQPKNYTGKATAVFARQGDRWRLVHGHESANPG